MDELVLQFGEHPGEFTERICAYAIVFNERQELLVLKVRDVYHLPGGGVEAGEDHQTATRRETMEEAGCEITDLRFLGKANQYFLKPKLKNLNKLATFYVARMISFEPSQATEPDHVPYWLTVEEFLNGPGRDFHKWAVKEAVRTISE